MFYCVYFFSPFHLKPILACLFSQGLGASCEISGFPKLVRGRRHLVSFPLLCSSLPLECSFSLSRILSLFPCGELLLALEGPARRPPPVVRKRLPSPLPLPGGAGFFPGSFLSVSCGSCHLSTWVITCATLFVPLGAFRVQDRVFLSSESPVLNYGLPSSPEPNRSGRKMCLGWVRC